MSLKELSQGRADIHKIDPRQIHIKKDWNGRDMNDVSNQEHIDTLAKSIAEIGVKEALTVATEDGKVVVIDGHCRWFAVMRAIEVYKAEIKTIPVKHEDRYANDADHLFSQIIRNAGKRFTDLESAKVYKRLLDMGWNQTDIAKKSGISPGRVSQVLALLEMPEAVKTMVTKGEVSASLASKTVTENPQTATRVLKEASMAAQSNGRKRLMPKDIAEVVPKAAKSESKERNPSILTVVSEAFEYAKYDEESEVDTVIVRFTSEEFEKIKKALKL